MHIVYSTITNDTDYVSYMPGKSTDASSKISKRVRIKGGANLAPLKGQLITPRGVATVVNDEDMDFLENNSAFKRHRDRGFIRVDKGSKPKDADVIAREMTKKDGSAPITKDSKEYLQGTTPVVEPTESSKARMK